MSTAYTHEIARPLSGPSYREVIALGAEQRLHGLLVLRDQLPVDTSANDLIQRLDPFRTERGSSWPGTVLGETAGFATLHHFALTDATVAVLLGVTDTIYNWQQPKLPEDLCILRPDDRTWLASIAHEEEAWFELTEEERALVASRLPGLLKA